MPFRGIPPRRRLIQSKDSLAGLIHERFDPDCRASALACRPESLPCMAPSPVISGYDRRSFRHVYKVGPRGRDATTPRCRSPVAGFPAV